MAAQPVPILLYHSVDTRCSPGYRRWMVTSAEFAVQMEILSELDRQPITISHLASRIAAGEPVATNAVAITFDDGLRDFVTGALPVLLRRGFPATLYVVAGLVGRRSVWLRPCGEGGRLMADWSDLRSLAAEGIEIGAHTMTHPELDLMSADSARREIRDSKSVLEDGLGARVRSFAYPFGYASSVTHSLVRDAGFESACRCGHAFSCPGENVYALSRLFVTGDTTQETFRNFAMGIGAPISRSWVRARLESAWRIVRSVSQSHVASSSDQLGSGATT